MGASGTDSGAFNTRDVWDFRWGGADGEEAETCLTLSEFSPLWRPGWEVTAPQGVQRRTAILTRDSIPRALVEGYQGQQ